MRIYSWNLILIGNNHIYIHYVGNNSEDKIWFIANYFRDFEPDIVKSRIATEEKIDTTARCIFMVSYKFDFVKLELSVFHSIPGAKSLGVGLEKTTCLDLDGLNKDASMVYVLERNKLFNSREYISLEKQRSLFLKYSKKRNQFKNFMEDLLVRIFEEKKRERRSKRAIKVDSKLKYSEGVPTTSSLSEARKVEI